MDTRGALVIPGEVVGNHHYILSSFLFLVQNKKCIFVLPLRKDLHFNLRKKKFLLIDSRVFFILDSRVSLWLGVDENISLIPRSRGLFYLPRVRAKVQAKVQAFKLLPEPNLVSYGEFGDIYECRNKS